MSQATRRAINWVEQGLVPDDLGVEAMARTTGEEAILRILGQEFR